MPGHPWGHRPSEGLPPAPGAGGGACLEDVEADGMALAVLAVLVQSDADTAGAWALRDRQGEARVARVGGKVPAAPCCLAGSPGAPQLHGLPLAGGQGLPRGRAPGRRLEGTVRERHTGGRLAARSRPAHCRPRTHTHLQEAAQAALPFPQLQASGEQPRALPCPSHLRETLPLEKTRSRNCPGTSFRKVLGTAR